MDKGKTVSSYSIGLVLSISLLAILFVRLSGFPVPGLARIIPAASKPQQSAIVVGTGYISPSWYAGANEYARAREEHQNSRAPLLVYFRTDWCSYCKKLDQDLLTTSDVNQFMRSVVKVRINPEAGLDERRLAEQFGVKGYPSIFIIPANSDAPTKVYPFRKVGDTFVALAPREFVDECQAASLAH